MLKVRKKNFLSNDYVAEESGVVVAELRRSRWRAQAEIAVQGRSLRLQKHGVLRDTFAVLDGDIPIIEVTQPTLWRSRLTFKFDGTEFQIMGKAWYSSRLLVKSGGAVVGSIRTRGLFVAGANVDLPDNLPLAVRVFVGWIAMIRWDEGAAAAAG